VHVHLQTPRLVLRRFTFDDVDALVDLDADPQVMFFINGGRPTPRREVEHDILPAFLAYYERGDDFGFWAVEGKDLGVDEHDAGAGRFLGWFHLRPPPDGDRPREPELGYRLRRDAWGRGYASEGARALVDKAFRDTHVALVYAETMAVNIASRRVMEKAGMRLVRTFHQQWPDRIPGDEHGDVEYAITREQWLRQGRS
jgi:RimJ/RimL family protein N-acetyltransferase